MAVDNAAAGRRAIRRGRWAGRGLVAFGVLVVATIVTVLLVDGFRFDERSFEPEWVVDDPPAVGLYLGTCNAEIRVAELVETTREVRIGVEIRRNTDDDCADQFTVELSEPLSDRVLVDLVGGGRWRVDGDRWLPMG